MQIRNLMISLRQVFSATPELAVLLPGNLFHGDRAISGAVKPYGLLTADLKEETEDTSGWSLVDYDLTLKVYTSMDSDRAAEICRVFHSWWDRLATLPALVESQARLVLIHPGPSTVIEAAPDEFGRDIIEATTSWLVKLQETV